MLDCLEHKKNKREIDWIDFFFFSLNDNSVNTESRGRGQALFSGVQQPDKGQWTQAEA